MVTKLKTNSPALRQEKAHVALNASEGGQFLVALCFELPAGGTDKALPKTITFIPAPDASGKITGRDGRTWIVRNAAAVVAQFTQACAITANHAGYLQAPKGGEAPAYGWISNPQVASDGSITVDVEWTPRGVAALNGRDYRFFSPEFVVDEKTSEVLSIYGGSLTNNPNFPQLALNAQQYIKEQQPMFKAIAQALGLAETATEAEVLVALNALKAEKQVALNAAQIPDPTKWKPAVELTAAITRAEAAETALNAMKTESRTAEINKTLDQAAADGKVIPATRDLYLAMCQQEGGLERFKAALPAMPVIGQAAANAEKKTEVQLNASSLTADEVAICAQTGVTHEQFIASKKGA